jgi:hypothetical protein
VPHARTASRPWVNVNFIVIAKVAGSAYLRSSPAVFDRIGDGVIFGGPLYVAEVIVS